MKDQLTDEELVAISMRWKNCSASSRAYSDCAWQVKSGSYDGSDWLVAACGSNSEDGMDYYVTTDGVHASELRGDACGDATFIANAPRDIRRLTKAYVELQQEVERLKSMNVFLTSERGSLLKLDPADD